MGLGLLVGLGFAAGSGEFAAGLLLEAARAAFLGGRFFLGIWKTGKVKKS